MPCNAQHATDGTLTGVTADFLADFTVDTTDPLNPAVTVNGERVNKSQLRAAVLEVGGPQVPTLTLHMAAAGTVEGKGIVQVVPDGTGDLLPEGEAVARFLSSMDPGQVEAAALSRAGGQGGNLIAAVLAVLADEARSLA